MKLFIFFFIVIAIFADCNPMRRIDMINNGNMDAEIIWTLKDLDSLYKSPFFLSNSKKIKFDLKTSKPYNEINMSFGTGSWTKQALDSITTRLDSLEIRSVSDTIKLGSEEMNAFLYERRKGLGKRRISIMIPDRKS